MLLAIAIGTALSATVGALTLLLGGVIEHRRRATRLAHLVARRLLRRARRGAVRPRLVAAAAGRAVTSAHWEALAVMAAVVVLTEMSFSMRTPVAYIVFPGLIWAAIRFGPRGATLALVIAVGPAIWNTVHYEGPFVFHTVTHAVLTTQLYIAVAEVTTLVIAAVVAEREEYARRLVASRARLIVASDTERRRIERNLHDGAQQRLVALAFRLRRSESEARIAPEAAPGLIAEAEDELLASGLGAAGACPRDPPRGPHDVGSRRGDQGSRGALDGAGSRAGGSRQRGSTTSPRERPTSSWSRPSPTRRSMLGPARSGFAWRRMPPTSASRSRTTASVAPSLASAPASRVFATGSRARAGQLASRARRPSERGSPPCSRSPRCSARGGC